MQKSLESLFSFEEEEMFVAETIEGPSFTSDDIQEAADVAADQTALEVTMESLELFSRHGISMEGIGENVKGFFKSIWDGIKKFFAWIGNIFKKFWDWITGKNKKLTEPEIKAVEEAKIPTPVTVEEVKAEVKEFVEERKEIIEEAKVIEEAIVELKKFVQAPSAQKLNAMGAKVKAIFKKIEEATGKWADKAEAKRAAKKEAESKTLSKKDIESFIDKSVLIESYSLSAVAQQAAAEAKKVSDRIAQQVNALMQSAQSILDKADSSGKSDLSESERMKFVHIIGKINTIIQKIEKKIIDPYAILALPCYKVLDAAKKYVAKSVASTGGDAERAEAQANKHKSYG